MFYTSDSENRAAFITSLRQFADFLAANPAVPVPKHGAEITLHADTYEDGGKQQVEHIASLLGAPVHDDVSDGHHCGTSRIFGCIGYRAVSISDTYTARRDARESYENNVVLDTGDVDTAKTGECPCGFAYEPSGDCPGSWSGCVWHNEGPDPDDYDMPEFHSSRADGGQQPS